MSQPSFEDDLEAVDFDAPSDAFETAGEVAPAPAAAPPAPRYRKQGFSIYTFMLIMSLVSLLIAMILLLIEASKYS